jgi:hypothetical protein
VKSTGITFRRLRHDSGEEGVEGGMPATAVYRQLWREEFRWESKQRPPAVIPTAKDPSLGLFLSACFGAFATAGHLHSFKGAYERLLQAVPLTIDMNNYLDGFPLLSGEGDAFLTPLRLGSHGLSARQINGLDHIEVLLVDPLAPSDLLDLWNLRASGRVVVPVPLCWHKEILPELAHRLASRADLRSSWDARVSVTGGHRVSNGEVMAAREQLTASGLECVQHPHPTPSREFSAAWVSAAEDEVDLRSSYRRFTVPLSQPSVAEHYPGGVLRWMTILNYLPWTLPRDGSIGAYLPPSLGDVSELLSQQSHQSVRVGPEGIMVATGHAGDHLDFLPPSGERILSQILTGSPTTAIPTEPGRAAAQLIKQIDGLFAIGLIQRRPLVELFNKAAHGAVVLDDDRQRPPRPSARFLPFKTVDQTIRDIHSKNSRGRENLMRGLIDRDVLRAGIQLICPHCGYTNWIQLDDIGRDIDCERCLESFTFPQDKPPGQHSWAYRPTGAFSIPDYANGGYTVAFALRFLSEGSLHLLRSSWCTGFQLDPSLEIDFAAAIVDEHDVDPRSSLVLGEAKSFGRFGPQDFKRAAALGRKYPKAILAFATLREELTALEKRSIASLARPKAKRHQDLRFEPRVLVLTAVELFDRRGAPECWKNTGGVGETLAKHGHSFGRSAIATWADVTLQLHIGLGPHLEWWEAERSRF